MHITSDSVFPQVATMLTDSLVTLVTECFRNCSVTAPRTAAPPLGLSFGFLRAGDCRRFAEDGLTLLTQGGSAWHLLYYLAVALLLFFIYYVAFSPVNRVRVSTISTCLCPCFLEQRSPPSTTRPTNC